MHVCVNFPFTSIESLQISYTWKLQFQCLSPSHVFLPFYITFILVFPPFINFSIISQKWLEKWIYEQQCNLVLSDHFSSLKLTPSETLITVVLKWNCFFLQPYFNNQFLSQPTHPILMHWCMRQKVSKIISRAFSTNSSKIAMRKKSLNRTIWHSWSFWRAPSKSKLT